MADRSFPYDAVSAPDERPESGASARPAPLAKRADFRLGNAIVRPSLRTVDGPAGARAAEPRVARVLMALADAGGAVLTREELIASCWDGLIVGDDAVNRVMFELRRIARETGSDFVVETVPRIGYRLVGAIEPILAAGQPRIRRRTLLAGSVAVAATAAGGWWAMRPRPDPRTEALLERAAQALRDDFPDSAEQGTGFLREAVERSPDDARAWGLLALALRNAAQHAPPEDVAAAVAEVERAAGRALALDKGNADAHAALATLRPYFGEWLQAERRFDALLKRAPGHAWALAEAGVFMESVGRSRESAALVTRAAEIEPLSPVHQYRLVYKHWILGNRTRADQIADRAVQLWPRHPGVLLARLLLFVWTGRLAPALRMVDDAEVRRAMMGPPMAEFWRATIGALDAPTPARLQPLRQRVFAMAAAAPGFVVIGVQGLAALGLIDDAFALLEGYLLRRGPHIGALRASADELPVNEIRSRKTMMLFLPSTAPLRADPRFERLMEDVGLAAYWRARGIVPDYRRDAR